MLLDSGLTFNDHIDFIVSKANRALGFIIRLSSEIRDPLCLKSLYCCWVRSLLEHGSVVWSPASSSSMDRIESVQRKFTRVAVRRFLSGYEVAMPSYHNRCQLLGLDFLKTRYEHSKAYFIACLLSHNLDVPSLLSSIPFYAPSRRLRDRPPLFIPSRLTRYGQNDPLLRAFSSFNASYHLFDFNVPVSRFLSRLRNFS